MTDKRKYVIQPQYGPMIGLLLFAAVRWFTPPSTYVFRPSRDVTIAFAIWVLLAFGKYYIFSERGIKVYILGIRIRNIPWSGIRRLIYIDDRHSIRAKSHQEFLVVEKISCNSCFPEEGFAWNSRVFFCTNLRGAFKIDLTLSKSKAQMEGIEQFHEIDDILVWEKDV